MLATQHMHEEPELRGLPEAERPIVARALAKDPEKRFPSCLAFLRALYNARRVAGKVVVEGGGFTHVDENSLIRRVEPISRKMHRLYSRIKKVPDRSQKITRELYKKALAAKGLPVRFLPK